MAVTINGTTGISGAPVTGTTGTFSGNVTANGLATELRPLVLMTAQASTSGTAFDFTGIPPWVKRIIVILDGVSLSAAGSLLVQIGDSGGIETTGYSSSGMSTTGAGGATLTATDGFIVRFGAAGVVYSGHMTLTLISGNKWVQSHSTGDHALASAGAGGGTKTLSDVLTQVRVTRTSTDTFDAGSINVMYE
jgi:hypothetical protein